MGESKEIVKVIILLDKKIEIKALLADPSLISLMRNLDVYNISTKVEVAIKKKIASNPDFDPKLVA